MHRKLFTLFMFLVLAHWGEHLFQLAQIYLLHIPKAKALGMLGWYFPGLVRGEWLHAGYAMLMLVGLVALRYGFAGRALAAWMVATYIQYFHLLEHGLLFAQAQLHFNLWGSKVPTSIVQALLPTGFRPELHLVYNLLVTVPMVVAQVYYMLPSVLPYLYQWGLLPRSCPVQYCVDRSTYQGLNLTEAQDVLDRVMGVWPNPYKVTIYPDLQATPHSNQSVDQNNAGFSPTAWVRPNLIVTRPLLTRTNPDALAFTLAHELGHASDAWVLARNILLYRGSPEHFASEDRADVYGLALARKAGYDPTYDNTGWIMNTQGLLEYWSRVPRQHGGLVRTEVLDYVLRREAWARENLRSMRVTQ